MKSGYLFLLLSFCANTAWAELSDSQILHHPQYIEDNEPFLIDIRGQWPVFCAPSDQKLVINEYTGDTVLIEFEPLVEQSDCGEAVVPYRVLVDMSDVIDTVEGDHPTVDITVRFAGEEITSRINKKCMLCDPPPPPRDVKPEAGLYYGDGLEKQGLLIGRQNQRMAVYPLIYDQSGSSEWLFGGSGIIEDVFFTELYELTGGQCLGCAPPDDPTQMNVVGKLTMLADREGLLQVKINDGPFTAYRPSVYGYEEMRLNYLYHEYYVISPDISGRWAFSTTETNNSDTTSPTDFLPLVFDVVLKSFIEVGPIPPIVPESPPRDRAAIYSVRNTKGEELAEMQCEGVPNYWYLESRYCVLNSPTLDEGSAPYDVELLSIERIKISEGTSETGIPDNRGTGTAVRID